MTLDRAHELKRSNPCIKKYPISKLITSPLLRSHKRERSSRTAPAEHKPLLERRLDRHSSSSRRGMYLGATEHEFSLYECSGVLHLKHGPLAGKLSHLGLDTRMAFQSPP